jgi:hypothetical protein
LASSHAAVARPIPDVPPEINATLSSIYLNHLY